MADAYRAPKKREESLAFYKSAILDCGTQKEANEVERWLARNDLFYLLIVLLEREDMNRDWIFARCREVEKNSDGYLDLWPREHYKSSVITFGLTIRDILRNPEITVGIFSFNRPTAKAFLRVIKREFESNERLKELFSDILWDQPQREAPTWSEDNGIIVKRQGNPKEGTIEAWGLVDGQPTSKHFGLMVYDDVVTADSVTNPDMIDKVTRAWETSRNLTTENGITRYIGTRWHHADTYRQIIDRGAAIERRHTVTVDGTVEGEPVLWTRERVAEKRREQGPYVFASQMLLDPSADRTHGFKEDWVHYYISGRDTTYTGYNKYLLVDPASEKKKASDYTSMVVIGLGSDENYYLLDAIRDRLNLKERGDAVFAMHRRWKPKAVGYEKYGMMADVEYIKDRQREENYRFEIRELGGGMGKLDRIRRLIPIFESGRFLLPESLIKVDYEGKHRDLVQIFLNDEYRPFPVALHDDMFDAISRLCDAEMSLIWPKAVEKPDERYTRRSNRRGGAKTWMAA